MRRALTFTAPVVAVYLSTACAGTTPPATSPVSLEVEVAAGASANVTPRPGAHAFTVDDMLSFERVGDASVSPDGKLVVFTVSTPDLEANKLTKDVWIAATDGSSVRRLTSHPEADSGARFAPDSRTVYFLSSRGGSSQVWRIAVDGGEATQVTRLPLDVGAVLPFPDGKRLLLAMDVFPDAPTLEESARRAEATAKSKQRVRAYDQLPVRHWDTWDDGTRSHLFVLQEGAPGEPVDLLKGLPYDAPTKPFGGLEEVAIARDGTEVVFASKMVGRTDAWSTNVDLWVVPSNGSARPRSLTAGNEATDTQPVFSHDGTRLAYLAMARPGFESDRLRVVVVDWRTKKATTLTEGWDRSPGSIAWSRDDRRLYATADDLGNHAIFAIDAASGKATRVVDRGTSEDVGVAGDRLVFERDDLQHPAELWTSDGNGGKAHPITHLNDGRAATIAWGPAEPFTFEGAHGDVVHAWLVRPPGVAAGAKVPVALLVHGGPQGSFGDHFHYRWNPEAFAGHGYAAVMVDFHGSTGYGQAFTDAIRGDWGGAPYEDLMKGLDAALSRYPFLDGNRVAALGASYGGYMINWINGKTDRFKALVVHDGNLDETAAYYETEELWFPEWEHGKTPWENPQGYAAQSPMSFVQNWKTPTLVVHGGRDYRIVDAQGMATFTALQRKGVPSRFLYFPEENHWVLKPAHSRRWHEEVFAWIDRYTKG
ncbi:MAG TPA: S9 family peptidase [Polyangiaceae bacterium]|jgi:dipeptidyl aminopeptidase/acylaminoacyl peptidase